MWRIVSQRYTVATDYFEKKYRIATQVGYPFWTVHLTYHPQTTPSMALASTLPIRLDSEIDSRLQAAAQACGSSKSSLVRLLIKTFAEQCIDADGTVKLPPDWQELLAPADLRSFRNASKFPQNRNFQGGAFLNESDTSIPMKDATQQPEPVRYKDITKKRKPKKP